MVAKQKILSVDDDNNIAEDTFNWNKTLEQAKITAPKASFILSA